MKNQKLSTQPYKGSRDFYPQDIQLRNYIFDVWKKVAQSYGYEQYDGPFLEPFDLFAAKSGNELVNEQLYSFEDRGGRKVAIRPEMTPTLARMVAARYKTLPRPIRWFSIPNLWRYEKPQRGRTREFFQFNIDIFGVEQVAADFEIISMAIDIMAEFGAKEGMYEIKVNNRRLMQDVYEMLKIKDEQALAVTKAIDKKAKVPASVFENILKDKANLSQEQIDKIVEFLENPNETVKTLQEQGSKGANELMDLLKLAKNAGKAAFVKYDPTVVRGLDYYTGCVFEQVDLNPKNNRAMYGGGRYDDLVGLFVEGELTGTGMAMGDVTLLNFLESWNLLPKLENRTQYLITVWPTEDKNDSKYAERSQDVAKQLRENGKNVEIWLEENTKIDKQLKYADKKGIPNVILIGDEEISQNKVTVKNMKDRTQITLELSELLKSAEKGARNDLRTDTP